MRPVRLAIRYPSCRMRQDRNRGARQPGLVLCERYLRSYRIHLGSGNILMQGDRYLCIVPGERRDALDVFLPFEGDRMLSIILSKAMMLAADDKITDPSILSQLGAA